MKKRLFLFTLIIMVAVLTACNFRLSGSNSGGGSGKLTDDASLQDLLDVYSEGIEEQNAEKIATIFIDFEHDIIKEQMSENVKRYLDEFGKGFTVKMTLLTKEAVSPKSFKDLDEINERIKELHDNYILASECYDFTLNIKIDGPKRTINEDEFSQGYWYCNFNGKWRLYS